MPRINSFFFLFFLFCASFAGARAQTPSIEVTTGEDGAQFSAQGQARSVRVEVYAPSGELVFEADSTAGQAVDWKMANRKGERVADGVYLATVTVTDSSGKRRKRIEQITVSSPQAAAQESGGALAAPAPEPNAAGAGTMGRIAKWMDNAGTLGNSVLTESTGKVGVNTTPAAVLQVNGLQPAALAANGTAATVLLQTSGGKGGNTTVSGKVAGKGADVALYAGAGGNAPAGSKNGSGGSVVLQAGSAGSGAGAAGANGSVLINPTGVGNLGVGTSSAPSRLTVNGMIQTTGAAGGVKFPNGTIQTTAALPAVQHDLTLAGAGTAASPLKVSVPLSLSGAAPSDAAPGNTGAVIRGVNSGSGSGVYGAGVTGVFGYGTANGGGSGVVGQASGYGNGVEGFGASGVRGQSSVVGPSGLYVGGSGVHGIAYNGDGVYGFGLNGVHGVGGGRGVYGQSDGGTGVNGVSTNGNGVYGESNSGIGVEGHSYSGTGVYGSSSTGYAGEFNGKVGVYGNLQVNGNQFFGAVTRQMLNLWNTAYGIGVQDSTQYFRTDFNFAWYKGGSHSDAMFDPGGGAVLMRLDSAGNLRTAGAVNPTSDRNAKRDFLAVDPRGVLERVARLPVQTWNYKTDDKAIRHMGPVAQDFRREFGLGADDRHISTVDADGVALASIQALYQLMLEKDKQVRQMMRRKDRQIQQLQAQLDQVRRAVRRRAARR